jgi:hypothetical protein
MKTNEAKMELVVNRGVLGTFQVGMLRALSDVGG